MILADKIMNLRKRNGWSQEELAEKLNVSRQSISKWEGAQSIPDLDKILKISKLFGVSTDYLIKDEIEEEEFINIKDNDSKIRVVSLEEANEYLEFQNSNSIKIDIATFLCIISPAFLFIGESFF